MISAAQALRLPSAKLTAAEKQAADALEASIDLFVRKEYSRGTVRYSAMETRVKVLDEVQWRIRKAGWTLQTFALEEESHISRQKRVVGFLLALSPPDEAYRAAEEIIASA